MSKPPKQSGGGITDVEKHRKAAEEREERQEHKDRVEIIRALDSVTHQLKAGQKLADRSDRKRGQRECLTIVFLFLTVIFTAGSVVIFYCTMMDARDVQRPYLASQSPLGVPEFVPTKKNLGKVRWTFSFNNYGKSAAYNMTPRYFMRFGASNEFVEIHPPGKLTPVRIYPGDLSFATALSDKEITRDAFNKLLNTDKGISLYVEWSYSDGYGTLYEDPLCSSHLTNGATLNCIGEFQPSDGLQR